MEREEEKQRVASTLSKKIYSVPRGFVSRPPKKNQFLLPKNSSYAYDGSFLRFKKNLSCEYPAKNL
jgi:hypothetical protein